MPFKRYTVLLKHKCHYMMQKENAVQNYIHKNTTQVYACQQKVLQAIRQNIKI